MSTEKRINSELAAENESLKAERDRFQQINKQTLQVKLQMAEAIKELTARVNALAVENAALKDGFEWLYAVVSSDEVSIPDEKYSAVTNAAAVLSETPATDAALAAIQARAKAEAFAEIIEFIDRRSGLAEMKTPWDLSSAIVAHIAELRESK